MSDTITCLAHGDKVILIRPDHKYNAYGRIQTVAGVEVQFYLLGQIPPSGPHAWFQRIIHPTGSWAGALMLNIGDEVRIDNISYEVSRYGIDAK